MIILVCGALCWVLEIEMNKTPALPAVLFGEEHSTSYYERGK